MKKLIVLILTIVAVVISSPSPSYAGLGCGTQMPPMCMHPSVPVCIDAGLGNQDYWVCVNLSR